MDEEFEAAVLGHAVELALAWVNGDLNVIGRRL